MTILIACGLAREAGLVAGPGIVAMAGGGDAARLERSLTAAIAAERPALLLSSGIAGALDPVLRVGDVVIDGDAAPLRWLEAALSSPRHEPKPRAAGAPGDAMTSLAARARSGRIIGQDAMVTSATAKAALHRDTGAAAVDMESHVAARVARRHGLPFAALRIVSDTAREELPPAVLVGMKPDGGMAPGAVLASLLRHPAQLPALIRTGRNAGIAFRQLGRVHHMLARAGIGRLDPGQFLLDMG